MTRDDTPSASPSDVLALDPIYIPGLIIPVHTEGADGGVNHHLIHTHVSGLVVNVQPYLNMQANDWIEVFWGDDTLPVASDRVLPEHVDKPFALFIRPSRIPEGVHNVYASVTRSGGGNGGTTADLGVLVRTVFPGGTDPDPGEPGHQNLVPPQPALPPGGIIDEEAARNGIEVTIPAYPNMRVHDTLRLDWGGESVLQVVTQADVDAGFAMILVTEQTILAAGDGDQLQVMYRIWDEVHNQSSEWSMRAYVAVEIGTGLFPAPVIENPDHDADPYDVIDLDELGEDDLLVDVVVFSNGLLKGDLITLTWTGTPAQGQPVTYTPEPQEVSRDPQVMSFLIPNAEVRGLALGRGAAAYRVIRDGSPAGPSKRAFVTFVGVEQRLPKPQVRDAVNGVLDPTLEQTLVTVPGEALEAGDTVFLTWLGTRANGSALLHTDEGGVSGGNAGKPMLFSIEAEHIAPLDGGSVAVYYRLNKGATDIDLDSDHELLSVGEMQYELQAPFTRPPAEDGVIDPDQLPGQLEVVVAPWTDMRDDQTVHLEWQPDSGVPYSDYMPISPAMVGKEVKFLVDQAKVEEYRDKTVDVSYWVERPGEPSLTSAKARFSIGTPEARLPLPRILEADGDEVDPDLIPNGATVEIDASALFAANDKVTVRVVSSAEGGSTQIEHTVLPGDAGKAVTVTVPHAVINASIGATFELHYEITRAAGGPVEPSETVIYSVVAEVGSGPIRIMGARFNASVYRASGRPRMLTALDDVTLKPQRVEWSYEGDQQWTSASRWIDSKPALKLFARNQSETWECRPANIIGNGNSISTVGYSAFVAMRDEVAGPGGIEVDIVAWGKPELGGSLDSSQSGLKNVAEVSANSVAYAARLRNGDVVCWNNGDAGGKPPLITGDYVQVCGNSYAFVGRQRNGDLFSWGSTSLNYGVPVPAPVLQHKDYIDLCSTWAAFAALRRNGQVVVWGNPDQGGQLRQGQDQYDGVTQLLGNTGAFVALRVKGNVRTVFSWGGPNWGGLVPDNITRLTNVSRLAAASMQSFCILLETGEVKAWPPNGQGGTIPPEISRLRNVLEVTASLGAYCARLSTGQIVAWGDEDYAGKLPVELEGLSNVVQVTANFNTFAALCSDGSVVAWGNPLYGGDTSSVADKLVDVRAIYSNSSGYTALTADGRVVTWGVPPGGGDSSKVQSQLTGKVTARRLLPPAESEAVARRVLDNTQTTGEQP